MDENTCVVCYSSLLEPYHRPVKRACACSARVCESCFAAQGGNTSCPTCRSRDSLLPTVDEEYVHTVIEKSVSMRCDGCRRTIPARYYTSHLRRCVAFVTLRYEQLFKENMHLTKCYRDTVERNKSLTRQVEHDVHVISFLQTHWRPPNMPLIQQEGSDMDTDEEEPPPPVLVLPTTAV